MNRKTEEELDEEGKAIENELLERKKILQEINEKDKEEILKKLNIENQEILDITVKLARCIEDKETRRILIESGIFNNENEFKATFKDSTLLAAIGRMNNTHIEEDREGIIEKAKEGKLDGMLPLSNYSLNKKEQALILFLFDDQNEKGKNLRKAFQEVKIIHRNPFADYDQELKHFYKFIQNKIAFEELKKEKIDSKMLNESLRIPELSAGLIKLAGHLDSGEIEKNTKIEEIDKKVNTKIEEIDKKVNTKIEEIDKKIKNDVNNIDTEIKNLRTELDDRLNIKSEELLNKVDSFASKDDLKTKAEEDSRKLREEKEKLEKVEQTLKDVEKDRKNENEKDKKVGIGISAVSLIGGAIVAYLTTGVISAAALAVAAGGFIGVVAVIISIAMEAKEPEETTTKKNEGKNEGKNVKLATQVSVNLPEMKKEKENANEENANEQSRMKEVLYKLANTRDQFKKID